MYLLLLSIVYWVLSPFPITETQLTWMLLGERLGQGFYLYQDIIDDSGPLSAAVFMIVDFLFGRSLLSYEIIGRLLVLAQIIYWNSILIQFKAFDDNTYLPGIIMAALFHFSFDMLSLSPALLGGTFLLLALGQLFSQTMLQREGSESTLLIGIYAGLAASFNPNYVIFLPYMIFTGIAISGFSFRQLILSLVGYFLPILLIAVFYFWNDGLQEAVEIWPLTFLYEKYRYQPMISWLILGAFPILLALVGYFVASVFKGSTINQQKQRQLMLIWLVFSSLAIFIFKRQASFQLLILIPGLSYLITHFFLNFRRGIISSASFYLLVLALPIISWWYWQNFQTDSSYFVKATSTEYPAEIMVFDEDPSPYLSASLGGPFLNYRLSRVYIDQERTLGQRARLFQMLQTQKSKLVTDPNGDFEKILTQFPALSKNYEKLDENTYRLK